MSTLSAPTSVFVFGSILYRHDQVSEPELFQKFEHQFGLSHIARHPFCTMKAYYSKEMGDIQNLDRVFFISHQPKPREILVPAKQWAIELERSYSLDNKRLVNFDVGVISLENLQLATGKNFTHRVYLSDHIYSDLTLIFQKDTYVTLPWSYPDYSHPEIINIFNWNRRLLQTTIDGTSLSNS